MNIFLKVLNDFHRARILPYTTCVDRKNPVKEGKPISAWLAIIKSTLETVVYLFASSAGNLVKTRFISLKACPTISRDTLH